MIFVPIMVIYCVGMLVLLYNFRFDLLDDVPNFAV
jgi:hypothetical protein